MEQIQFISTSPNALVQLIDETVKKRIDELKNNFEPIKPNDYLTRFDVAGMLNINLSTIHNWTKKGILTAHQIGGRVYYKRNEVENSLIKLKK